MFSIIYNKSGVYRFNFYFLFYLKPEYFIFKVVLIITEIATRRSIDYVTYLDACVFFLSFLESLELVESVESLRDNDNADCTPLRTKLLIGFNATLLLEKKFKIDIQNKLGFLFKILPIFFTW